MTEDKTAEEDLAKAREVLDAAGPEAGLVNVLLDVQDRVGWLPRDVMREVADRMGISDTEVYSVASFYNQFRFRHPGRRRIQICMGTACHVKRAKVILESFERKLEIREGEVTDDLEYGLERVNCVGCCTLAPVAVIDDEVVGDMSPSKVDGILLKHEMERGRGGEEDG